MTRETARALKSGDKVLVRDAGHYEVWTIQYIKVYHNGNVFIEDEEGCTIDTTVSELAILI